MRGLEEATKDLVKLLIYEVDREQIITLLPYRSAGLVQQRSFKQQD